MANQKITYLSPTRYGIPNLRTFSSTVAVPLKSMTHKTQSAVKSAESKSEQLSKNSLYFSSVQDFETLRKFVHCRPVGKRLENTGDRSLRKLFDDRLMREFSEYWAACLYNCDTNLKVIKLFFGLLVTHGTMSQQCTGSVWNHFNLKNYVRLLLTTWAIWCC